MLHGAALAALVLLHQRQPADAPPERGVEIFWDQEASEAVGEAEAPDSPGAPPEAPAPPEAEAPPPPPPPPPSMAAIPPPPIPAPLPPAPLALPPLELPMPALAVAPPQEPPPEPLRETEMAAPPPPEPPRQQAQRPRPTPPPRPVQRSQPPAEASRAGEEAATQNAAGLGRATGAVVPPGPDARYQNAAPAYPEVARLRGEQGTVALELAVGTDGRVITVTVARSSGSPMLDAAARRAVQEWRFRPAMRDGEPVVGTIRTSVHFRLQ